MSKYTPGPWEAGEGKLDGGYMGVFKKDGMEVICRVSPLRAMTEEDVYNARLIAAAPDMYEALITLRNSLYFERNTESVICATDRAIAKAEGEA